MQNRYVGDIGDYVKYALLRCILRVEGGQLGIAWYLYPDEVNGDGGHTEYLDHPKSESWKRLDDQLFGKLKALVDASERSIFAIQRDSEILGGSTRFYSDELKPPRALRPNTRANFRARQEWRKSWFANLRSKLEGCNLIFADPDNGLFETGDYRYGTVSHWKRIPLREVETLATNGRTVVVYHHHTRRRGGHTAEIDFWLGELGPNAVAVRSSAWSPRSFFVVNPSKKMIDELSMFAAKSTKLSFHDPNGACAAGIADRCENALLDATSHAYRSRIRTLCADAADEGYSVRSASERGFWNFVSGMPHLRKGDVVLMDNGNLRAVWKDEKGTHLGLQFLGEGVVQYVIFKRRNRSRQISRVTGRDTLEGFKFQIDAYQLHSLLYK